VEEEADETVFWIEMVADAGLVKHELVKELLQEAKELLAIVTASRKTAKSRRIASKR
jgi:four helix bundle protein